MTGITPPDTVNGVKQQRIDGISMAYSFDDSKAKSKRNEQYFEMLGNRAIYKDGWVAATTPRRMPWSVEFLSKEYSWELYNVEKDFSESDNLATKYPDKLKELQKEFDRVATENNVLPIDDTFIQRFDPSLRPNAFGNKKVFTYYPNELPFRPSEFPFFIN